MNKSEAALRLRRYLDYIQKNNVDRAIWEPLETAIDVLMGNYNYDPNFWTPEAIEAVMKDKADKKWGMYNDQSITKSSRNN